MPEISSERKARMLAARKAYRYMRQFPKILSDGTGEPMEYEIPHSTALYVLDGADKYQRLEASSRNYPCVSYTGQSRVWKETRNEN